MKQNIPYKALNLICIFLVFLGIYHINTLAPLVPGDDFLYQCIFPENGIYGDQRPQSISDFLESSINHYINYNYRVLPHLLLQVLLALPHWVFDLINTIVFFILPIVVLRPFKDRFNKDRLGVYTIVLILIWLLHPDISWSYFWTTGSISYSWFLILQLFLITSFFMKWENGRKLTTTDVFISFLCSTSNEAVVLSLFIAGAVLVWREYTLKSKLDRKLIYVLLILMLGGLFMLLSPSFTTRIHNTYTDGGETSFFSVEKLMRQAYYLFRIGIIGIIYFCFKQKEYQLNHSKYLLFVIGVVSLIMFTVPIYETRSAVFPFFVGIIFFLSTLRSFKGIRLWPLVVGMLISIILYQSQIDRYLYLKGPFERNFEKLKSSYSKEDTLSLESFCPLAMNSNIMCDDISTDKNHFHNRSLSAAFNVSGVIPSELFSVSQRNQNLKLAILEKRLNTTHRISLGSYKCFEELYLEEIFFLNSKKEGQDNMVVKLNLKPEGPYTIIVRGSRRSFFHYLLDYLPLKVRISFLDFLERDRQGILVEEKYYYNNPIYNIDQYRYFVISCYSYRSHNIVGVPFILKYQE